MTRRQIGHPTYRVALVTAEGEAIGEEMGLSEWAFWEEVQDKEALVRVPAAAGQAHYVTSISASYDQPVIGRLSLREGAVEKAAWFVHGSRDVPYPLALCCAEGDPLELSLAIPAKADKKIRLSILITGYTR